MKDFGSIIIKDKKKKERERERKNKIALRTWEGFTLFYSA